MDIAQTRVAYVEDKAERLVKAAGLSGKAAELTRAAVRANFITVVAQFEANDRLVRDGS